MGKNGWRILAPKAAHGAVGVDLTLFHLEVWRGVDGWGFTVRDRGHYVRLRAGEGFVGEKEAKDEAVKAALEVLDEQKLSLWTLAEG